MKRVNLALFVFALIATGSSIARAEGQQRACDTYIQKFCTSGSDHGPGCLKGHESDVSAECLKDMAHKGPPPEDKGDGEGH